MKIRTEDIIFWLVIGAIIAIALWLLSGSPPEINALISIALFVAVSEIILWKAFFKIDKRTEVGLTKAKYDIANLRSEINNRFDNIENLIKKNRRTPIIKGRGPRGKLGFPRGL